MLGTIATTVRAMATRATSARSPLEDRLAGVDAGGVVQTLLAEGRLRRLGPRTYEHVPTGRTYQSAQLLVYFHDGYQRAQNLEGDVPPSSIEIELSETGGQFIHRPTGERFESDLAVQTFESGWEAGR